MPPDLYPPPACAVCGRLVGEAADNNVDGDLPVSIFRYGLDADAVWGLILDRKFGVEKA